MQITFEGTPDEVRAQVFEFFGIGAEEQQPTPINGVAKPPGRPRKQATPPLDPAAASPAAPAAAQPTGATQMMPACSDHAKTLGPNIKAIPAEKSACLPCQNDATAAKSSGGKPMTLDEVKTVAEHFGESRPDGWDILFRILGTMGAESLTGAENTKALEPARFEEFAKQILAVEAPKPARKSI